MRGQGSFSTLDTELMLWPLTERISVRGGRVSLIDIQPVQLPVAPCLGFNALWSPC